MQRGDAQEPGSCSARVSPDPPEAAEVRAAAERLLHDLGRCSPMDLLLAMRLLRPEDHEAWCRGERARLDDALAGGPAGARRCLEAAGRWAGALGLTARHDVLSGTGGHPAEDLVASSDPRLNELLRTSFFPRPAQEAEQLDLFLDSPVTSAVNALLDALWAGDPGEGRRARARLMERVPGHAQAASAAALIEMLETPPPGDAARGQEWTGRLEREWAPAASALFGARGAQWLAPRWCAAGRAIESGRLDPRRPERHPSAAYLRGLDWQGVKRSVLATPDYEAEPALLARLAEAEWRLGDRHQAISHWFTLCWRAPEAFRKLVAGRDFPDRAVRDAWNLAEDRDDPGSETFPEWFPAWMLLHEYGLARTLALRQGGRSGGPEPGREGDPERAFGLLTALLTTSAGDAGNVELRRELGSIHPGLLRRYLAKLEPRPAGRPASSP